jgi:RES domain-containing protein
MFVWRISNYVDLGGAGGVRAEGRWHNAGAPIVYCALHPATALVEKLVHEVVEPSWLPDTYKYLKIDVPDGLTTMKLPHLPTGWQGDLIYTRAIGDDWLSKCGTALLFVPCVLVPEAENVLINPRHPDAASIRIVEEIDFPLDGRFLKTAPPVAASGVP